MEDYNHLQNDNVKKEKNNDDDDIKSTSSWSPIIKTRKRFLKEETELLEKKYSADISPSINEIEVLANQIGTTKKIITTWFQNRRAKEKRKRKRNIIKHNNKVKTLNDSEHNNESQDEHKDLLFSPTTNTFLRYMTPIYSNSNIIPYQYNDVTDNSSSSSITTTTLLMNNNQYSYLTSIPTLQCIPSNSVLTSDTFLFNSDLIFFNSQLNIGSESIPSQVGNAVYLNEMNNNSFSSLFGTEGYLDFHYFLHS
ncbi:unnamed protein product [Cunninghamella blakesleeana]